MNNFNMLLNVEMQTNVYFEMAAIPMDIILFIYLIVAYRKDRHKTDISFTWLTASIMWATIFHVIVAAIDAMYPDISSGVYIFLNILGIFFGGVVGICFIYYVDSHVRSRQTRLRISYISFSMFMVFVVLLLTNPLTHAILYGNIQDGYAKGPLYNLVTYIFPMAFVTVGTTILILYRNAYRWTQIHALVISLFLVLGTSFLQMIFLGDFYIAYFGVSLAEWVLFLALESPDYKRLVDAKLKLEAIQNELLSAREDENQEEQQERVLEMTRHIARGDWYKELEERENGELPSIAEKIRAITSGIVEDGKYKEPGLDEKAEDGAASEQHQGTQYTKGQSVVMIVDDNPAIIDQVKKALRSRYEVIGISSGAEVLDQLEVFQPELLLMDVYMPGIDGEEVLRRMKRSKNARQVPVVMLDNENDAQMENIAFRYGAEDYISKPFVPSILLHRVNRIIELHRLERNLNEEVLRQTKRTGKLSRQVMEALSNTVEAKDLYTSGHSRRVAEIAAEIAFRAGKSDTEVQEIFAIGLMHDIGKVGIADEIINKDGRLNEEEYGQMKKHPEIGYEILKTISTMPGLARGARWHHERYDGTGYPDGLSGESIPEEARIISIADTFDAMTTARTYVQIKPMQTVRQEFLRCRGTQFDPYFADIMVQIIDDKIEEQKSKNTQS